MIESPDLLIGTLARACTFANTARRKVVPAGTEVQVRASAIEAGRAYVYALVPGTHYAAVLHVSAVQPV
jgi:hypothetical protein